jgi:hypothetical protein
LRRTWIGRGRVATKDNERGSQDDGEGRRTVIGHSSIREGEADDQRTHDEDPTEHQRDSKPSGRVPKLAPEAPRTQRKNGHAQAHEKDQPNQEAAQGVSVL